MKRRIIRLCLLLVLVGAVATDVNAQAKPRTSSKRKPPAKKPNTVKNSANNNAQALAKDTVKPAVVVLEAEIKLDTIRKSLRNDNAVERNLVKDRSPLTYENIREDDAVYRQRLWREIDVHEKMNLPFVYKADDDNGNQRFLNILLNSIKSGELTAFNATIDDRFTTPMTLKEIANMLVGKPRIEQVQDWINDPDGSKGLKKDTMITEQYNPDIVEKFWIKEDV
ncbi:MAG TPA: hypothetical protein VJT83_02370, partial [Chitinophagaceae bacterium]|nr:hypothetical protein [Chitinophagaceae bacterium]